MTVHPPIAIIGGSSLLKSSLFSSKLIRTVINTKFGDCVIHISSSSGLVFVQRHGADPAYDYRPPHAINGRAIITALKSLGCRTIIALCSAGSLKSTLLPGSLVIPDDYFFPYVPTTAFDTAEGHVIPGFDSELRKRIIDAIRASDMCSSITIVDGGVYGQANGPRFESKSEIRFLSTYADVVGMTGAAEAALAGEAGLSYAMVCMVDNMANGIEQKSSAALSVDGFYKASHDNCGIVEKAMYEILKALWPVAASELSMSYSSNLISAISSKITVDCIVYAKYIVPVIPRDTVLFEHALIIQDQVIIDILPSRDARHKYSSAQTIIRPNHALLPGFINAHTHLGMSHLRGNGDDKNLVDWLSHYIWPVESKFMSEEFVSVGTRLGLAEMIRSGVTGVNDMYFFPDAAIKIFDQVGVRASVGLVVLDFPSAWAATADEYIEKGLTVRNKFSPEALGHRRISFTLAPHAPYTVCDEVLSKIQKLSDELNLKVHVHLHETITECNDSELQNTNSPQKHRSNEACRPFSNFDRLKLVNNRLIAVHMTSLTPEEIQRCSETGAAVVHCPCSNMKLASGFCPVPGLLAAGVTVGLGTDSAASNNSLDMIQEIRLAALIAKGFSGNPTVVTAMEALEMATIGGAKALGWDAVTGSLQVGKHADIVAIEIGQRVDMTPLYNLISHLVYVAHRDCVTDVWCDGKLLLKDRQLLTIDEQEVVSEANLWMIKISNFQNMKE